MKQGGEKEAKVVRSVVVAALFIAAVLGGWAIARSVTTSPELLIRHVEIDGLRHLQREDILALAGLDRPQRSLQLDPAAMRHRLLQSPWIEDVQIRRPGREHLFIDVSEAVPRVIVPAPHLVLADASGHVIDVVDARYHALPLVTGASRSVPSSEDRARLDAATLALSRGLGGALVNEFDHDVVDGGVVRDAVKLIDIWESHDTEGRFKVKEVSWDAADGFAMVVAEDVDILVGHRAFDARLARAHLIIVEDRSALPTLQGIDTRGRDHAVVRFADVLLETKR